MPWCSGKWTISSNPCRGVPCALCSFSDAGEVLTLQRAAFVGEAQIYDDPHLPALTQTLAELEHEIRTSTGIVAVVAGRIVAAIRMRCCVDTLYVNRLAVAPEHQGQGIGTALMLAAEHAGAAARQLVYRSAEFGQSPLLPTTRLRRRRPEHQTRGNGLHPHGQGCPCS